MMNKIKFPLVTKSQTNGTVIYPDDVGLFSDYEEKDGWVYARYRGDKVFEKDDRVFGVNLEIIVAEKMRVGVEYPFSGLFDLPINAPEGDEIPLTLLDRNGDHVKNLAVVVNKGVVQGTVVFDKSGDYYITNKGINFHTKAVEYPIKLKNEILIRVMD